MKKRYSLFIVLLCIQVGIAQQSPTSISIGKLVRISPKLTDIKQTEVKIRKEKSRKFGEKDPANKRVRFSVENPIAKSKDGALQTSVKKSSTTVNALTATFDGALSAENVPLIGGRVLPPDNNLSVGPNHVVQMVNSFHKVYNKTGTLLAGPLLFSSIASTAQDDGDPIVLYDQVADRWVLLQFNLPAGSESIIFCISQTPDPTGSYFVYEFPTVGVFPDYPHVGVWNNSYVITTHEFNQAGTAYLGQGFYAVDRTKMVNGEPTSTLIRFQDPTEGGYLPVSFEGFKTPEPNSPAIFTGFNADEFGVGSGFVDELWIRTLNPDFVNPGASTLSARTTLPVASFDGRSPNSRSAIEQSGTTVGLDAIADRMMSRVIYRRFDNSESLVMNYGVNVSGVNPTASNTFQAAMRWYELTRPTSASAWTINQQSTYQPEGAAGISGATGINRWMGSIGIDQRGNIAVGHSKSSSTTFPSINYAERKKTDPLNTLGAEQVFHAGTASQTNSTSRWGDYTSMATDPTDEETIWFTNEYYIPSTASTADWRTRIGSFIINDPLASPTVHFKFGGTIARQVESTTPSSGFPFKDYLITVKIDNAPSQAVDLTFTKTGTATEGVDYDLLNTSSFSLIAGTLTKDLTLRVYDNGTGETDEFIEIAYTLNVNGGNGIAGSFNQKHRVTIVPKVVCPVVNIAFTRPTTFCESDSTILTATNNPNYTYKWFRNSVEISGQTAFQLVVKESGSYFASITNEGCTLPTSPIFVTANFGTPAPTTVSRTITAGTIITAGNGLQASSICPGLMTATYAGPTVGYDGGNQSTVDPTATVSGAGTNLRKVKVSIRWQKKDGGNQNSCATADGGANPFNSEVSFKIVSPNNVTINLLDDGTYVDGGTTAGLITTVFEDGGAVVGTVPAAGTFSPAQSLGVLNAIDPNGVWKLLARDSGGSDPLCVESFSVTVYTSGTGGASTITWYSSATGGSSIATGTEYIPTDTAPGTYTYYAEAGCTIPGLLCSTSIRKPATLTITSQCVTTAGAVISDAAVCAGTNSGTLTLSGHTGSVIRWESSTDNFVNSTPIVNNTTLFNYFNLTQTTKFRAVVQNGSCLSANSSAATITVNTVSATSNNAGPYFVGQTIQLTATGGGTYAWTGPNSFISASNPANIASATLAMAGIYTVTVTQGICTATATTNVVVTNNNACTTLVEYDYVQAGNPFVYKFPLTNNIVIAEVPEETSILVNPICPTVPIESFKMKIVGMPYLHEVVESVHYFALFNNTGAYILGRHFLPGNYVLTITGYDQDNALGNVVYGPVVTNFTVVSSSATISAPSFAISSLCAGTTFNVNFTATGVFNPANMFDVQLSDASGTFDNPTIIGSSASAGVVACTIPINIPLGSNYKIRVVSTNQILSGNTNGSNLTAITASLNLVSPTNDISIGTSTKQASQTITATNKVLSPANTTYKAGNAILLNAGFQASSSSVFKAEIGGCN